MDEDSVIATVGDLIAHLQRNFRPEDKLCFWDEGGCVHELRTCHEGFAWRHD